MDGDVSARPAKRSFPFVRTLRGSRPVLATPRSPCLKGRSRDRSICSPDMIT